MAPVEDEDVREFNEGVELMRSGDLDGAVEKFRAAASTGVDRPMEHYALAVALYRKKEYVEAKKEMERFLAASPADNRYVRKARTILPVIAEKLAQQQPRAGKRESPLAAHEPYNRALNAYLRGDYAPALEGFRETLKDFPGDKHVTNNLGLAYLALREQQMAINCFVKAIAADPGFPDPRNNLGLAWLDYGAAKAKETFESLVREAPDFFDGLVNLASLCYREGDLARARQLWERARAIRPDDPQVKRNLEAYG